MRRNTVATMTSRTATLLAAAALVGCLCLRSIAAPGLSGWEGGVKYHSRGEYLADGMGEDVDEEEGIAMEGLDDLRRMLRGMDFEEADFAVDGDYDAAFAAAFAAEEDPGRLVPEVRPYTLEDALAESRMFEYTFVIVVYDPPSDNFVGLYSKDHRWKAGNKKLFKAVRYLCFLLRKEFPERFVPGSPEFVLAVAGGDYPHVKTSRRALPHSGTAPVLMFGSAFRDRGVYANMIAMPMPDARHLDCFVEWKELGSVCAELRPAPPPRTAGKLANEGKLVFGAEHGVGWDDLIPQLVWRGTDFSFLPTLQKRPKLGKPDPKKFVPNGEGHAARAKAIRALNEQYDTLLPRWKGAALTAQAELDAEAAGDELPWANIKFTSYLAGGKSPTRGSAKYAAWESVGVGVGDGIWPSELVRYKYHKDLGGGGGTTWSGTLEKLSMPGVLFHHVTPTRDYIHDRLAPWRHYVPVASDLGDLKAKFDWLEGHEEEAKRIAEEGTDFMRRLGTPEGFERMYKGNLLEPLRRAVEAYRPVSSVWPEAGSWRDVLSSMEDCRVIPVIECTGVRHGGASCNMVGGKDVLDFQKNGRYTGK